jgi:hypothetical protein
MVAAVLGGCSDGTTPPPPPSPSLLKLDGDQQVGIVGQPLPTPLVVQVNQGDSPLEGATVVWSADEFSGSLDPTTSLTDAAGLASTTWTLGTFAGTPGIQASVTGADGSPVIFRAEAQPAAADSLERGTGNGQNGPPNTLLPGRFSARVLDEFGNAVPAVPVVWAATNATVSATTVPTNVSGFSLINVTLGSQVGPATITATVEGLSGSPVTFTAVVVAGP